jgi:altronate dehydratase small subunit
MLMEASDMPEMAVRIHPDDNVATAVRAIPAGRTACAVRIRRAIPVGHKFALTRIAKGCRVVKYGETIGLASRAIRPGDHVHVHNVAGTRGRGDLHASSVKKGARKSGPLSRGKSNRNSRPLSRGEGNRNSRPLSPPRERARVRGVPA